jgi:hypothetical protein
MEPQVPAESEKKGETSGVLRGTVAVVVLLTTCAYIAAILLGKIPRLTPADISVIALAAGVASILLRPQLLDKLTHLKVAGLELDWLQKLQEGQKKQQDELDDVRFVLTLLLQPSELKHLRNLEKGATQYQGNEAVCNELRKLRTLGLIQNRKGRAIGEIAGKRTLDLNDFVELTERGRHYLERLGEYDEKKQ